MTVGESILKRRKELGMSQEELGQKLPVSRQTVSQWETDQTVPTIDNLMRLKEVFGISVDEILNGSSKDAARAEMPIYARAYVLLADGTYIYSDTVDITLRAVTETIDSDLYQSLSAAEKAGLLAMYQQFADLMESWEIPNIKNDLK